MIDKIHVHPKVEKRLDQMEGLEKAPSIAAKRARIIIQSLVDGVQPSHAGRLSKRKDARIDNLFKFDLGSGYRLVCIKEKFCIHILYVGSHDNCDTWLDANSRKKPHKTGVCMKVYCVVPSQAEGMTEEFPAESECFMIPEISQEDLKKVFRGIAGCIPPVTFNWQETRKF
ncbi:MAG: hypothetical protein A2277_19720 [Desulfobacterales bacterium RIFOXYA12_FULL_46_15]|nr:MAG: hypothetical protein A2277_19720 [Desulfobacterales bacterium RIFOXYA12_FULL_46_15]